MTVKQGYDFSKIHRVAIQNFEGTGGDAVKNEFVRELVGSSLNITEHRKGADVVLMGAVTEYKPGDKLMVFLGDSNTVTPSGQAVVVTNPVVTLSGTQVTPQGTAMGVPNTQILSVSASVGVIARLVDAQTGDIVWSDTYSYEGLDIQSAMQAVISSLTKSLSRVVPAAKARS